MPCWQVLPEFLAETKYQNPTDSTHTPFQKAHGTDLVPFLWLQDKPVYLKNFGAWMTASREGQNIFLDVFPFEKELTSDSKPETPLFVDIGGSIGHQCVALKRKLPNTPGRVILQDLPPVIAHAIPAEGIELMAHDFMTEQPVKGKINFSAVSNSNIMFVLVTSLQELEPTTCATSCMTIRTIHVS